MTLRIILSYPILPIHLIPIITFLLIPPIHPTQNEKHWIMSYLNILQNSKVKILIQEFIFEEHCIDCRIESLH